MSKHNSFLLTARMQQRFLSWYYMAQERREKADLGYGYSTYKRQERKSPKEKETYSFIGIQYMHTNKWQLRQKRCHTLLCRKKGESLISFWNKDWCLLCHILLVLSFSLFLPPFFISTAQSHRRKRFFSHFSPIQREKKASNWFFNTVTVIWAVAPFIDIKTCF